MCFTGLYLESWGGDAVAAQLDTEALPPPCAIDQALPKPLAKWAESSPELRNPICFSHLNPHSYWPTFPTSALLFPQLTTRHLQQYLF